MRERLSADISIMRQVNAGGHRVWRNIATVPIGEASVRKFTLMSEDCIVLSFDLFEPTAFIAGDRINDELFGRYYLSKAQLPTYNESTSAWHYELQFDREYITFRNKLFMLTAVDADGVRQRKEAVWTLTGSLADHADELLNNLDVLGYWWYTVEIKDSAKRAKEVHTLNYSGTNIFDALNRLAEEFGCEWWVKWYETDKSIIYFGKCEDEGEPMEWGIGTTCTNIIPHDNRNTYTNRIYVYGSKDNIPLTYRKKLYLRCTGLDNAYGTNFFYSDKKLTRDMFGVTENVNISLSNTLKWRGGGEWITAIGSVVKVPYTDSYRITNPSPIKLPSFYAPEGGNFTVEAKVILQWQGGDAEIKKSAVTKRYNAPDAGEMVDIDGIEIPAFSTSKILDAEEEYSVIIRYSVTKVTNSTPTENQPAFGIDSTLIDVHDIILAANKTASRGIIKAEWNDNEVWLMLNPLSLSQYNEYNGSTEIPWYYGIAFSDESGHILNLPYGFMKGSVIEVTDKHDLLVPSAFYATAYDDPTALARIGERRLQLPLTDEEGQPLNGFIDIRNPRVLSEERFESVVYFEDVYPDAKLVIDSITTEHKTDYTEYEGERVKNDWQWEEYTLHLKLANGQDFKFKKEYQLPNTTLQLRFITPHDMGWAEQDYQDKCKLASMTFDVRFNPGTDTFTIVRSDAYGALLPNNILKPKEDDPCVLIGWNVKSMTEMGLIESAEQRLLAKGREYVAALEEGMFTFDCTMFFDYMFDQIRYLRLLTNSRERVKDSEGAYIYVKNNHREYAIPTEGAKVIILHPALEAPKTSRIIGYELKLDKPYDAPKYVVGETPAYSKLAQIEREITKISNNN